MPHCKTTVFLLAHFIVAAGSQAFAAEKPNAKRDLIAFVGRRLSVTPKPSESWFDAKFEARYQVLQVVFGRYDSPKITFTGYHHVVLQFPGYDTVLLFVSRYEGKFYHEKYQFFPVYRTADGRWAGCGDPYRFEFGYRGRLKPVPIKFAPDVKDEETGRPCSKGNYVEDLFLVKKHDLLNAQ